MSDNHILVGAQRQEQLEAAKAAFYASGGQDTVLPSFTFKPMPERRHPEPTQKIAKVAREGLRQQRSKERIAIIAEMAKSMTCKKVSQELGVSQNTLWTMASREGFSFATDARARRPVQKTDDRADAKLAERITALRDVGLTRHQVEKQIGIGNGTLKRILKAFDIEFPKFGERKPVSGNGNEKAQAE